MKGTLNQEVARTVGVFNIAGPSEIQIRDIFSRYERRNIRSKDVSFQMSINPNPAIPGESLSDGEVLSLAKEIMDGLGYGNQPIVIYQHTDIDRHHYHVVSIRTNEKGKKIKDAQEQARLQDLALRLAGKYHYELGLGDGKEKKKSETLSGNRALVNRLRFVPTEGNKREQFAQIFNSALCSL